MTTFADIEDAMEPWDGFVTDPPHPAISTERHPLKGKRILISGAGGFIGSALVRELARLGAGPLILFDHAEYGLYRLEEQLQESGFASRFDLVLGSVADSVLLRRLFAAHRPEIVFHAAALKHVPLLQTNLIAATETNALGTQTLAEISASSGVERFVLLSTDKAVEPISVMGATKRLGELFMQAMQFEQATRFKTVRLCNVLGSTGSVAPRFARQIAHKRPLTVTHPEATRYFISLRHAVACLLQAAIECAPWGLAVPAIAAPRRIEELARTMLARQPLSAGTPSGIVYTNLRPGERLHEQLVGPHEHLDQGTPHALLQPVHTPLVDAAELRFHLQRIREAAADRDPRALSRALALAVPGYDRSAS